MNRNNNIRQPTRVNERVRSRTKTRSVKNSGYSEGGASRKKNSMKGYQADSRSPIDDIDKNLYVLRRRSRDLYMTAPIATSAIENNRTNVVGQGLQLKCRIDRDVLGLTEDEADAWERNTEKWFSLWADDTFCDIKRLDNFYELQQIAMKNWLLNGDAFALLRKGTAVKNRPFDLRIQLLEADRVTTEGSNGSSNLIKKLDDGNKIINGVEINKFGEVLAYWICSCYPTDMEAKTWTRVNAFGEKTNTRNVLHIFEGERAEQYRGVPYLAKVIEALKQTTRYTESEVMAALINAMFSIFIEIEAGSDTGGFSGYPTDNSQSTNNTADYKLGTGTINFLEPGEKIKPVDPSRPNVNFDTFVSAMCKQMGAALEIPSDILLKKFDSSYSASRAAQMEAWKMFRMRRTWFANDFCQPIYEAWLTEAIIKGYIKAPGFFNNPLVRKAWTTCEWSGPAQGQIDPVKEVVAAGKRVEFGFSTIEQETLLLNGGDYDKNMQQRMIEVKKMAEIEKMKSSILNSQQTDTV